MTPITVETLRRLLDGLGGDVEFEVRIHPVHKLGFHCVFSAYAVPLPEFGSRPTTRVVLWATAKVPPAAAEAPCPP